jgi:hypothetical protein
VALKLEASQVQRTTKEIGGVVFLRFAALVLSEASTGRGLDEREREREREADT